MNRRFLTLAILVFFIGVTIWAVYSQWVHGTNGELKLTLIPNDTDVLVGNVDYHNATTIELNPGNYTVTFSRSGFSSQIQHYTLVAGKSQGHEVVLSANSQEGRQWLKDHPDQARQGEAYSGKVIDQGTKTLNQHYPILAVLPAFTNGTWKIDSGPSKKYPDDPSKIALYITATNEEAKQEALQWMIDQGYNAASYEIIYNVYSEQPQGIQ